MGRRNGGRVRARGDLARLVLAIAVLSPLLARSTSGRAQEAVPPDLPPPAGASPHARKGPPRLVYSAPPECPDEASFKDEVALVSGTTTPGDPFDASSDNVVRVTFRKVPGGYRGRVQYTPSGGDPWPAEEATGALCALLLRSVAITASLRIPDPPPKTADLPATAEPPGSAEIAPTPKGRDPVPSEAPEEPAPSPFPLGRRELRPPPRAPLDDMDLTIALSASALMTAGFTADVGPGFQIGADVRGDVFGLGLELRGVLPARVVAREPVPPEAVQYPNPGGVTYPAEFDVSQFTGALVPCFRFAKLFAACGVVQAGALIVNTPAVTAVDEFVAFGPRFAVELPIGDMFGVFGFGEALFVPDTGTFRLTIPGANTPAPNVQWTRSPVSGFFGAGLSLKFQ